ncbi:hypothetical protein D8B26_000700 [Coccidioides posadasii str. Silveira]|uniref:Uncharacterized protein n=1 Tax=Coccidioides posadasii (strain RMSCC 757 / Silveira) TaxID=443226 RepID=E9D8M4_COCPS|nr:conserved hypothetical protein [Coccidioides posadasii str. Silveira]QVM05990.1 hypothetical protein D8B26_000700 [Coccidioides posadasii str. Silveira]
MSTAVVPPTAALLGPMVDRDSSPKSYPSLAPLSAAPSSTPTPTRVPSGSNEVPTEKNTPEGKRSPNTSRSGGPAPKIAIKKEPPTSPSLQPGTRHRPRKLDLSTSTPGNNLSTRGPLTARDGRAMQDVGLACLSPGFQTQDPAMREQLQRSMNVRDQQRSIIEARLQQSAKGDGQESAKQPEPSPFGSQRSSKKRPPPGLSIVPPSASQFANERVIHSAPLNQTFTGRRQPQPLTRHFTNQDFSGSPQIHHTPANQTSNRLPPIADVFGADTLPLRDRDSNGRGAFGQPTPSQLALGPLPSPGLPGGGQPSGRPREYRSAEEAVHELAGGREELLPRIVHYNGNKATSPRSPPNLHSSNSGNSTGGPPNGVQHPNSIPSQPHSMSNPTGAGRRRTRHEYEQDNGSPPLGTGPDMRFRTGPGPSAYGPFGAGRDSPETQRRKKEEFLSLCARAWDLFHS